MLVIHLDYVMMLAYLGDSIIFAYNGEYMEYRMLLIHLCYRVLLVGVGSTNLWPNVPFRLLLVICARMCYKS